MYVLVVEDNLKIQRALEHRCGTEGFTVDCAERGEEGIRSAQGNLYDLIVLDLCLPDISGIEVLRRLRAANNGTPVIVLSRESGVPSKVRLLNLGADDYVVKPFAADEVIARIHAVVRRAMRRQHRPETIGVVTINSEKSTCKVKGKTIPLTYAELRLLEQLSEGAGQLLVPEKLNESSSSRATALTACRLRKKIFSLLGEELGAQCFQTVRGRGYRLCIAENSAE